MGADHLVAGDQAGDGAVGDSDQEGFCGYGWEAQYALDSVGDGGGPEVERCVRFAEVDDIAQHFRRFAQKHGQIEVIDGFVVE